MGGTQIILLPKEDSVLKHLGENIRLARLRRKINAEMVAERANIGRATLWRIERGDANVRIGAFLKVLFVLGLHEDLANVAKDDVLGRKLQDAGLTTRARAPKRK